MDQILIQLARNLKSPLLLLVVIISSITTFFLSTFYIIPAINCQIRDVRENYVSKDKLSDQLAPIKIQIENLGTNLNTYHDDVKKTLDILLVPRKHISAVDI